MNRSDDTIPHQGAIEDAPDIFPNGGNKANREHIAHGHIYVVDTTPQRVTQASTKPTPKAEAVSGSTRCQTTKAHGPLCTFRVLQPRYLRFTDMTSVFKSDGKSIRQYYPLVPKENVSESKAAMTFPKWSSQTLQK
ncbi:hypothetical protein MPER_05432 [Moniliophthora perniciosa FA553]|nr:hypothetical protein MPER_05432 [Moniliophthora perniciosa FA553]